jgi:hypothetical protein
MVDLRLVPSTGQWNKSSITVFKGEIAMQAAIDRVMQTYIMIVNLNPDEERLRGKK